MLEKKRNSSFQSLSDAVKLTSTSTPRVITYSSETEAAAGTIATLPTLQEEKYYTAQNSGMCLKYCMIPWFGNDHMLADERQLVSSLGPSSALQFPAREYKRQVQKVISEIFFLSFRTISDYSLNSSTLDTFEPMAAKRATSCQHPLIWIQLTKKTRMLTFLKKRKFRNTRWDTPSLSLLLKLLKSLDCE